MILGGDSAGIAAAGRASRSLDPSSGTMVHSHRVPRALLKMIFQIKTERKGTMDFLTVEFLFVSEIVHGIPIIQQLLQKILEIFLDLSSKSTILQLDRSAHSFPSI